MWQLKLCDRETNSEQKKKRKVKKGPGFIIQASTKHRKKIRKMSKRGVRFLTSQYYRC